MVTGFLYLNICHDGCLLSLAIQCGEGWVHYNGFCYLLQKNHKDKETWFGARDQCHAFGAHIVSIENEEENGFITSLVSKYFSESLIWIGLNDLEQDVYQWVNGVPLFFISWKFGEPNNGGEGERCGAIDTVGEWSDTDCYKLQPYVCKKEFGNSHDFTDIPTHQPIGGCPTDFFALPGTSRCFHVGGRNERTTKTFDEAEKACAAIFPKSRLASIHSDIDQKFATILLADLKTTAAWIGLKKHYAQQEMQDLFRWVDDSQQNFDHWGIGQPDSNYAKLQCVNMQVDTKTAGFWKNSDCEEKLSYICEYRRDVIFPLVQWPIVGQDQGIHLFRDSNYKFVEGPVIWNAAETMCLQFGGHLINIDDKFESVFLDLFLMSQNKQHNQVWIGLSQQPDNQTYEWSDGQPIMFTNWFISQPNLTKRCVAHKLDVGWTTRQCDTQLGFVCEIKKDRKITTPFTSLSTTERTQSTIATFFPSMTTRKTPTTEIISTKSKTMTPITAKVSRRTPTTGSMFKTKSTTIIPITATSSRTSTTIAPMTEMTSISTMLSPVTTNSSKEKSAMTTFESTQAKSKSTQVAKTTEAGLNQAEASSGSRSLSQGAIYGIVGGSLAVVLIIIIIALLLKRRLVRLRENEHEERRLEFVNRTYSSSSVA